MRIYILTGINTASALFYVFKKTQLPVCIEFKIYSTLRFKYGTSTL